MTPTTPTPERELVETIVRDVSELDGVYASGDPDVLHVSVGDLTIIVERAIESLLADKARLEEAIIEVRNGYASQMKYCDIEALGYFREFLRRLDEALNRSQNNAG